MDDDRTIPTNLNPQDDPERTMATDLSPGAGRPETAPTMMPQRSAVAPEDAPWPEIPGFSIIGKLGEGGMGVVYKGVQSNLRRPVAIKVLKTELAADADFAARFRREADVAARLSHPNIVGIYDVGSVAGPAGEQLYMAFQYVGGGDLAEQVRARGPMAEAKALRLMLGCCDGLQAIADAGLVHRDIKPGNIFLDERGHPVIGDLGLARSVGGNDMLTMTGQAMGTPAYMSPEHLLALPDVDIRTDLYALGATLFKLVTGHEPYVGDSPYAITHMVLNDAASPDPRSYDPSLSDGILAIIHRAMRKDREQRYRNPADMKIDIEAVLQGRPLVFAEAVSLRRLETTADDEQPAEPSPILAGRGRRGLPQIDRRIAMIVVGVILVVWFTILANMLQSGPAQPPWASAGGRDKLGVWAEIQLAGQTLRLRRIAAPDSAIELGGTDLEPAFMAGEEQRSGTIAGPYWIAEQELDQTTWRLIRQDNPSRFVDDFKPVDSVTCLEAEDFCARVTTLLGTEGVRCRLPTEAEWEYAARAGRPGAYAVGADGSWQTGANVAEADVRALWENAWAADRGDDPIFEEVFARPPDDIEMIGPRSVVDGSPNAWGLRDVHGNVAEWCRDATGTALTKGGSWLDHPGRCRIAAREPQPADLSDPRIGLRLVVVEEP